MEIICPTCNSSYKIADNKIPPGKRIATTCRRCGGKIVIDTRPGPVRDEGVQAEPVAGSAPPPPEKTAPAISTEAAGPDTMAILADFPELQDLDPVQFVLEQILKPNRKGGYKSRRNKHKVKILKALHDPLTKILGENERVMGVAFGVAYYPAELFFGNGYFTMLYNYYGIFCTDRRLLFINVNSKIKYPTHYLFQLPYANIKKVKRGMFGLRVSLDKVKGKRRTFNMKPHYSKAIREFIEERKASARGEGMDTPHMHLENLCPACFVPQDKGLVKCAGCGAPFKEPKKALIRSLLLPGLGDIYLGHRVLGVVELLGSAIVWIFIINLVISGRTENMIMALIILVFFNGFDGLLTYHMAKKGYMLAKKD